MHGPGNIKIAKERRNGSCFLNISRMRVITARVRATRGPAAHYNSSQDEASDRFRAEAVPSRSVPSDHSNSTTKNAHFVVQKGHIVQSDVIHSWLPRRNNQRRQRSSTATGPRCTGSRNDSCMQTIESPPTSH